MSTSTSTGVTFTGTSRYSADFQNLINRALAIDIDAAPDQRLANVMAQRRAKWLLGRMDRLFID